MQENNYTRKIPPLFLCPPCERKIIEFSGTELLRRTVVGAELRELLLPPFDWRWCDEGDTDGWRWRSPPAAPVTILWERPKSAIFTWKFLSRRTLWDLLHMQIEFEIQLLLIKSFIHI